MRSDLKTSLETAAQYTDSVVIPYVAIHLPQRTVCLVSSLADGETRKAYDGIDATALTDVSAVQCVASWGELQSTLDWAESLSGAVPDTKVFSFMLSASNDTYSIIKELIEQQNFEGTYCDLFLEVNIPNASPPVKDALLLERLIIQDPFSLSESSKVVQINCVSVSQGSDPFVGAADGAGGFVPYVLSAETLSALVVGTHPVTTLNAELSSTDTTIVTTATNLSSLGFPSSGSIVIDLEVISYTGISSSNTFTGCTRATVNDTYFDAAAGVHPTGAEISLYGHDYIYTFGTLPAGASLGGLYVTGDVPYKGTTPYSVYVSGGVAYASFKHKRPFTPLRAPSTVARYFYGTVTEATETLTTGAWRDLDELSETAGAAWIQLTGETVAPSVTYATLEMSYPDMQSFCAPSTGFSPAVVVHETMWVRYANLASPIAYDFDLRIGDVSYIKDTEYTGGTVTEPVVHSVSVPLQLVPSTLFNFKYAARTTNDSQYFAGNAKAIVYYSRFKVLGSFASLTSPVAAEDLSLHLTGGSSSVNPADAIEYILNVKGESSIIDSSSFASASSHYSSNGFFFKGIIEGNKTCTEALVQCLKGCFSKLTYAGGKVYLYPISQQFDLDFSYMSSNSNRSIGSVKIDRSPFDIVANSLVVNYYDFGLSSPKNKTIKDTASIFAVGERGEELDLTMLSAETAVDKVAGLWLKLLSSAKTVTSFTSGLDAYHLEAGDSVVLMSDWQIAALSIGDVTAVTLKFGSAGKNQSPFTAQVQFKSAPDFVILPSSAVGSKESLQIDSSMSHGYGYDYMPYGCAYTG